MTEFDGLKQLDKEKEWAFRLRVRDTARLCGNLFSKNQLITCFILGTHEGIKLIILIGKAQRGQVPFDEFSRRGEALADSHSALLRESNRKGRAMLMWLSDKHTHSAEGRQRAHSLTWND